MPAVVIIKEPASEHDTGAFAIGEILVKDKRRVLIATRVGLIDCISRGFGIYRAIRAYTVSAGNINTLNQEWGVTLQLEHMQDMVESQSAINKVVGQHEFKRKVAMTIATK